MAFIFRNDFMLKLMLSIFEKKRVITDDKLNAKHSVAVIFSRESTLLNQTIFFEE